MADPSGPVRDLTPRELEIAALIGRGYTYAEIAGILTRTSGARVRLNTVRAHVRNMAAKFEEPKELAPRWRVYMWIKSTEWAVEHDATGGNK